MQTSPSRSSWPTSPTRSRCARFRAVDLQVETKPDLTPVTEADRAVEQAIRERLAAGAARATPWSARSTARAGPSDRRWIIDPIDGTKNYVRGVPVWATLIALQAAGVGQVGVVSAPALHRRWWAAGAAARSPTAGRSACRASGGWPTPTSPTPASSGWEQHGRLPGLPRPVRRGAGGPAGSATSGPTCWSPRAAADIAAEPEVSLWDLAALQVIVEEAGGRFTDLSGVATAEGGSAVSSNGLLHDEALRLLAPRLTEPEH